MSPPTIQHPAGYQRTARRGAPSSVSYSLRSPKRRKVSLVDGRLTQLIQDLVESTESDLRWSRNLDSNRLIATAEVHDQAGLDTTRTTSLLSGFARKVVVAGEGQTVTERDF